MTKKKKNKDKVNVRESENSTDGRNDQKQVN